MADQIESLYDDVNDALKRRMARIEDPPDPRAMAKLLSQIRAMKLIAGQLTGSPTALRERALVDAMRNIKGELDR